MECNVHSCELCDNADFHQWNMMHVQCNLIVYATTDLDAGLVQLVGAPWAEMDEICAHVAISNLPRGRKCILNRSGLVVA